MDKELRHKRIQGIIIGATGSVVFGIFTEWQFGVIYFLLWANFCGIYEIANKMK